MNRNINFKTLEERKKELVNLKVEWERMKKEEENLKGQFYNSSFAEKPRLKRELTDLQERIFKKKDAGTILKIDIEREESLKNRGNPGGNPTDSKQLANLIKANLREILTSDKKPKQVFGDYWEIAQGKEIWAFTKNKEIKKLIENLPRHRGSKEEIVNDIKPSDLGVDYDEILKLVRQVREFWLEKDKQEREEETNKLKNYNSALFSHHESSTDPDYNGIGYWQSWHDFSGYYNGFEYEIMVPKEHLALTNVLFNDGWGTNSEIKNFYVVEGVAVPTELYYWNQAKQKHEIISEAEARRTGKKAYYHKIIALNDKITIRHYDEKADKGYVKTIEGQWSGVNKELVEDKSHKGGGIITHSGAKENHQLDNDFLLKYFQENDIKEISLTPEGNLLIKYNSGSKSEVMNDRINQPELQKVISYYQEKNQTSLSRQDLINKNNSSSTQPRNTNNNTLLISCGLGGVLMIGVVIRLAMRRSEVKKH